MRLYFILLSFLLFTSCNSDSTDNLLTDNSIDNERVETLPTILNKNNTSVGMRASFTSSGDFEQNVNFVSRYYKWNNAYDANHHYSLETPNGTSNKNVIDYGIQKDFFGSNYIYEGISFYTFKYLNSNSVFGQGPDVELRSVYLPESNNTILYTLKPGAVDPYQNYSVKSHLGYISSTPSYNSELTAIREYYSRKEKDYFYVSDDVTAYKMGQEISNYTFSKIIGYTFQSYRLSPYYYNYFNVSIDFSAWPSNFNKYGQAELYLNFTSEIILGTGLATGSKVSTKTQPILLEGGNSYSIYSSATQDILSSDCTIYYYDSNGNKRMIKLGNWYFSNNFPNASTFSYIKNINGNNIKIEFKRTAVNLWNIHLSQA